MPIMTGYESTRSIRAVESERRDSYEYQQHSRFNSPFASPLLSPSALLSTSFPFHFNSPGQKPKGFANTNSVDLHLNSSDLKLNRPALIIALTGFSSKQDQESAFESGADVFMTKPVRFREVGRILEKWMRSRERENKKVELATGEQKREVDEGMSGVKRSG
jgi:CheY-like chemotaxis protein